MSKVIFVQTSTDHFISINVSPGDTIKQVKDKIQDKTGVVPHRLIFAEENLDDGKCFYDYRIPEFAKIYCFSKKLSNLYAEIASLVQIDHNYCSPISPDVDDADELPDNTRLSLLDHTYCLPQYLPLEIFENTEGRTTLEPLVLKKNVSSELQNQDSKDSVDSKDESLISDYSEKENSHLSSKPKCTCASEINDPYLGRKSLPTDSLTPDIDWSQIKIPELTTQALREQIGVIGEPNEEVVLKNVLDAEIHISKILSDIDWSNVKIPKLITQALGEKSGVIGEPNQKDAVKIGSDAEIDVSKLVTESAVISEQPDEVYRKKLFDHIVNALEILIRAFETTANMVHGIKDPNDLAELKEHLTIIDSTIEMQSPVLRNYNIGVEDHLSLLIFGEELLTMFRRLSRLTSRSVPSELEVSLKKCKTAAKELKLSMNNVQEHFPTYFDDMENYILLSPESQEVTYQTPVTPNGLVEQESVLVVETVQNVPQAEQIDVNQVPVPKKKPKKPTNVKGAGLTRRQKHQTKVSNYLEDCLPKLLRPNYLHLIDFKGTERNTVAADYPGSFGILSSRLLPKINQFIVSCSTGTWTITLNQPNSTIFLTKEEIEKAERLHRILFDDILTTTHDCIFNPDNSNMKFYVVPVLNGNIKWQFLDHHSQQLPLFKAEILPATLYRISSLLLAEELRSSIFTEMSPTAPQQVVLSWPVLDLSKTDTLNPTHVPRLPCEDITTNESEILSFCREVDFKINPGPDPGLVLQALTLEKAKDQINHERLEVIGDSFLEYAIILKLLVEFPQAHVSQIFKLKVDLVKNLTLFNLAQLKGLSAYLIAKPFVESEWIPPCYASHSPISISEVALCDKCIADTVQALIGTYLLAWGQRGALLYMQWIGLNPLPNKHTQTPTIGDFFQWPNYAPCLTIGSETPATEEELHLTLNIQTPYNFTNNDILAKLLLKHKYEREYQRMVCLGNTILHYITTRFIFQRQTDLTPAELSRLRAAVMMKESLALTAVKFNFHTMIGGGGARKKFKILEESSFFKFFKEHGHVPSELPPVGESKYRILADFFRGFAAAIFIDSRNNLDIVWQYYFPMLKPTLDHFQEEIPVDVMLKVQKLLKKTDPFSQTFQKDGMFHYQILLPNGMLIDGKARAKKTARYLALRKALDELEKRPKK